MFPSASSSARHICGSTGPPGRGRTSSGRRTWRYGPMTAAICPKGPSSRILPSFAASASCVPCLRRRTRGYRAKPCVFWCNIAAACPGIAPGMDGSSGNCRVFQVRALPWPHPCSDRLVRPPGRCAAGRWTVWIGTWPSRPATQTPVPSRRRPISMTSCLGRQSGLPPAPGAPASTLRGDMEATAEAVAALAHIARGNSADAVPLWLRALGRLRPA